MLILANREAEYFFPDDWTGFCAACPSGKSPLAPFLFEIKALGKASGLPTRDKDVQGISDRQRPLLGAKRTYTHKGGQRVFRR
jgi:hypothetical protein